MASTIFCIIDIARQKNEAEPKDVVKRKLVSTTMNDMNEIQIIQSKINIKSVIIYSLTVLLVLLPSILKAGEEIRWKYLTSKI